jgi:hypothetical protein
MDLNKVTFPTFVLEPRSMLERITDFMSHPELVFGYVHVVFLCSDSVVLLILCSADQEEQPEERFIRVLMYYISGWHVKPKGVKKPYVHWNRFHPMRNTHDSRLGRYNPVLGEFFRCRYDYSNGTRGYYIAEQGVCVPRPARAMHTNLQRQCRTIRPYRLTFTYHPPIISVYRVN